MESENCCEVTIMTDIFTINIVINVLISATLFFYVYVNYDGII